MWHERCSTEEIFKRIITDNMLSLLLGATASAIYHHSCTTKHTAAKQVSHRPLILAPRLTLSCELTLANIVTSNREVEFPNVGWGWQLPIKLASRGMTLKLLTYHRANVSLTLRDIGRPLINRTSPNRQQKGYSLKPFKISFALSSSEDISGIVCFRFFEKKNPGSGE